MLDTLQTAFASTLNYIANIPAINLLVTIGTFLISGLVSYLIYAHKTRTAIGLPSLLEYAFPEKGWSSKSTEMDIFIFVILKLTKSFATIGNAFLTGTVTLITIWVLNRFVDAPAPVNMGLSGVLIGAAACFVVADFSYYMAHYIAHKTPLFWALHKVHHSATFMSPVTESRIHPLEAKFDYIVEYSMLGIPVGIFQFYWGVDPAAMLLMLINYRLIWNVVFLRTLQHTHIPVSFGIFEYLFISPSMHQIHHSARRDQWDKNMGLRLAIWDWMFGTALRPEKGQKIEFGIGRGVEEDRLYETIYGIYILPLTDVWKVLTGRNIEHDVEDPAIAVQGTVSGNRREQALPPVQLNDELPERP